MNFSSLDFNITCSFKKTGIDLLWNLKDESHVSITPSSLNTFSYLAPNLHHHVSLILM